MSKNTGSIHLKTYRDSVHSVVKPCAHCQTPFETKFGMYCSDLCKSRAYREKAKTERLKDLVCFFCGGPVGERQTKFCCEEHKNKFHKAKSSNKPILLRINNKMVVETKKYDSIPEVIKKYKAQLVNYNH